MSQHHRDLRVVVPTCMILGLGAGFAICRFQQTTAVAAVGGHTTQADGSDSPQPAAGVDTTQAGDSGPPQPAEPGSSPPVAEQPKLLPTNLEGQNTTDPSKAGDNNPTTPANKPTTGSSPAVPEPPKLSPSKLRSQTTAGSSKAVDNDPITPANKSTMTKNKSARKTSRKDRCISSGEITKNSKDDLAKRQRARREQSLYPVGPIEEIGLGLSAKTLEEGKEDTDAASPVKYQELEEEFFSLQQMELPARVGQDEDGNPFWDSPPETEECIRLFQTKRIKLYSESAQYLDRMKNVIENKSTLKLRAKKSALRSIEERRALLRLELHKAELEDLIIKGGLLPELDVSTTEARNEFLEAQFESKRFAAAFEDLLYQFLDLKFPLDDATQPNLLQQGQRHDSVQKSTDMKRAARVYYNTREPVPEDESGNERQKARYWCPITKIYHGVDSLKVGHIVPYYMTGRLAAHLFNFPSELGEREVIWNAKNTLPMSHVIERLFDKHMVTLVPESSTEFRFLVLDSEAGKTQVYARGPGPNFETTETTVGALHNTTLEWKNDRRPSHSFLFWHFLFSLKRRRASGVLDWQYDNETIKLDVKGHEVDFRQVWASPRGFLSKSLLGVMAQRDGFTNLPKEFYKKLDEYSIAEEDRHQEIPQGEGNLLAAASDFATEQRIADRQAEEADYDL